MVPGYVLQYKDVTEVRTEDGSNKQLDTPGQVLVSVVTSPQPLDTPHQLQLHQLMREQLLGKWREEEEGEELIDLKYL